MYFYPEHVEGAQRVEFADGSAVYLVMVRTRTEARLLVRHVIAKRCEEKFEAAFAAASKALHDFAEEIKVAQWDLPIAGPRPLLHRPTIAPASEHLCGAGRPRQLPSTYG